MSTATPTVREIDPNGLFFSEEELTELHKRLVPKHIAVIPDGNRRWAESAQTGTGEGHWQGADTLMDFVLASKQLGVEFVTVYGFSTENWGRSTTEVKLIMSVLHAYIHQLRKAMVKNDIVLETIGDLSQLPEKVQQTIAEVKEETAQGKGITLVLALNYGARNDLCRAMHKIIDDVQAGELDKEQLTEDTISQYLDTSKLPDPDLMIRTSGEMRLSNFLLWQLSYAEFYVTDVLWPAYRPHHLLEAVREYQRRNRRLGAQ